VLRQLHWLPVRQRVAFKIAGLVRLVPWPSFDMRRKCYGDRPREPLRQGS